MEERDMKHILSINLATLLRDIVDNILNSEEVEIDESGVWCTLNGEYLLVTWADLIDIRDSPDINKSLRDEIQDFMVERGKA